VSGLLKAMSTYWEGFYRPQKQPQGPPPPQTIAQQVCDQSRDLASRFRALHSGWSYLAQLRYFELLTNELPRRLDALSMALTPRYAVKTQPSAGEWLKRLERVSSRLATVAWLSDTSVVRVSRQLDNHGITPSQTKAPRKNGELPQCQA